MRFMNGALIATTVATMLSGFSGCSDDSKVTGTTQGIRCEGGNSCSGMSECKAAGKNECQGMNSCAGMGFITTETQAACDAARAAQRSDSGSRG